MLPSLALLLLGYTPTVAQAPVAPVVAPTGTLEELRVGGEAVAFQAALLVVKTGWNGMWADQRQADAAAFRTTTEGGRTSIEGQLPTEGGVIDLTESVEPTEEGLRLRYSLRPSVDLAGEGVFLSVILPASLVAGTGSWYANDGAAVRSAAFPAQLPDPYHLVGGPMSWIAWTLPSGQGLRFDLTRSTIKSASLQDDRQWNTPNFELHLPVPGTNLIKAGQTVEFELFLTPFTAQQAQAEEAAMEEARKREIVPLESTKPLRLGRIRPPQQPPTQYQRLELDIDLDATYDNPFNPAQIEVEATITCPGGATLAVPGFFYVPYERATPNGNEVLRKSGDPVWKVRFTPMAAGRHECTVRAKDRSGEVRSEPLRFEVKPSQDRGFVRRSDQSPYYLRFDSGDPYFAVGENVCWGGGRQTLDYDLWFPKLGAAGGNYARIWLVRWNMGLEWSDKDGSVRGKFPGLGRYSPDNAWRLDYVMDLAEKHGIYVMLCLGYHGELMDERGYFGEQCWEFNPYNRANGGPCEKPADFWTDPQARALYKQRLRYYVARYGAGTHVLSFEFWNEVVAPAPWVAEMSSYLRSIDPYRHLITTTYGYDEVWRLPEIDYTQTHTYGQGETRPDCVEEIARLCRTHTEQFRKPHLVGEFGIDWQKSDTDHDPQGHGTNLHNGLWAALSSRSMGGAAVWYWDGYVEPLNLYREFTALSRFAQDVPWDQLDPRLAETTIPVREPAAGEPWRDRELRPGMGWGKATGTDFTLNPDGSLTGEGAFSQFLYSPVKPEERMPLRFRVTCPQGGKLVLHVATVSVRALLQVLIDGQLAWEREFKSGPPGEGEYKTTEWREQWQMWQSTFDQEHTVDIPPGEHTVELDNKEGDWIEIDRYRFVGCVDPRFVSTLDVLGLNTDDFAILWLHNRASSWLNLAQGLPIDPTPPCTFTLQGLRDGRYTIEWHDTQTGEKTREEATECRDNRLTLSLPEIASDVACKVRVSR